MHKFIKYLGFYSALFTVSACVPTKSMRMSNPETIKGAGFSVSVETTSPRIYTPSMLIIGGGLASALKGSSIQEKFNIKDPAYSFSNKASDHLKASYSMTPGDKFRVEIKSHNFYIGDNVGDGSDNYVMLYMVVTQLIDNQTNKVLAISRCDYMTPKESMLNPATYLKNDADEIKKSVEAAANFCFDKFKNEI